MYTQLTLQCNPNEKGQVYIQTFLQLTVHCRCTTVMSLYLLPSDNQHAIGHPPQSPSSVHILNDDNVVCSQAHQCHSCQIRGC